jgi:hypothetical protein
MRHAPTMAHMLAFSLVACEAVHRNMRARLCQRRILMPHIHVTQGHSVPLEGPQRSIQQQLGDQVVEPPNHHAKLHARSNQAALIGGHCVAALGSCGDGPQPPQGLLPRRRGCCCRVAGQRVARSCCMGPCRDNAKARGTGEERQQPSPKLPASRLLAVTVTCGN